MDLISILQYKFLHLSVQTTALNHVTERQVENVIRKLPSNKFPGMNNIKR